MLLNILLLLAALDSGLAGLLYFMQSHMVYYPNVGRDVSTTPRAIGLEYEDVWLDGGEDKDTLAGGKGDEVYVVDHVGESESD